jgi:catecholate siderophore receptor
MKSPFPRLSSSSFRAAVLPALAGLLALAPAALGQTLAAPAAEPPTKMNPFSVEATKGQSYGASNMASATRMNTPIENVPQAISVVNANLLQDIGSYSFDQAMRYTPGVTQRQNAPDGAIIRGLASAFNHYEDGYFAPAVVTDMANIDRIEVIKGPSASIAGASESAGFVNYITKMPLFTMQRSADVTVGSWNFLRGVVDVTGPVPGYNNVAYRVVASYLNSDTFRDNERIRKTAVYPSLTWRITADTELFVRIASVSNLTPGGFGTAYLAPTFGATATPIVVPANAKTPLNRWAPLHVNTSGASGMGRRNSLESGMFVFKHRFADFLTARQSGNYYTFENDLYRNSLADNFTYDANGNLLGTFGVNRTIARSQAMRFQGDVALNLKFLSDNLELRGLAGYEVARTRGSSLLYASANGVIPINLLAPVYDQGLPTELLNTGNSNTKGGGFSTFANAQLGILRDLVILTGGVRRDENKASWTRNNLSGAVTNTRTTPVITSPLAGLTIKPRKWVSLFAVYSNAGAAAANVSTFPNIPASDARQILVSVTPDTTNKEFGARFTLFKESLSLGVSHFDTTQNNITRNQTDPTFPGGSRNFIDSGNNAKGLEFSWAGDVTRDLSIYGGYTNIKTSAPGSKPGGGQLELRGTPRDKVQMFARYQLRRSSEGAFSVKAGFVRQTSVYGRASNTYVIPGATRLDLGLDYRNKDWSFATGIINVTDEVFPTFAVGQGSNTIDDPRNFYFSIGRKF